MPSDDEILKRQLLLEILDELGSQRMRGDRTRPVVETSAKVDALGAELRARLDESERRVAAALADLSNSVRELHVLARARVG